MIFQYGGRRSCFAFYCSCSLLYRVGLVLCPINNASGEYSWKKAEADAAAEREREAET